MAHVESIGYDPMNETHRKGEKVQNSVESTWLAHLTDEQIADAIEQNREALIRRAYFPGKAVVECDSVDEALKIAGCDFQVEKRVNLNTSVTLGPDGIPTEMPDVDWTAQIDPSTVHTARTDTGVKLGNVGPDYGVVQYAKAFEVLDILAKRQDCQIVNVESIDQGGRCRIVAMLGSTVFESVDGAPNTIATLAVFEASHTGDSSVTAKIEQVRLECFNGLTSNVVVQARKIRHTSRASDRMEQFSEQLLRHLIGDAQAELELFKRLTQVEMDAAQFRLFATDWLGGEPEEDASKNKRTRFDNAITELEEIFGNGNEGAGSTLWGGYMTVTRYLEAKREQVEDAAKAAKKFESGLSGDGQKKRGRALQALAKMAG